MVLCEWRSNGSIHPFVMIVSGMKGDLAMSIRMAYRRRYFQTYQLHILQVYSGCETAYEVVQDIVRSKMRMQYVPRTHQLDLIDEEKLSLGKEEAGQTL